MTVPNRYESSTLQALAAALSSGLNPQQGLSIWNSLQSEYDQRAQQQQQAAQAQMDSLRKLAVQDASAGMSQDNTRLQMQALYPNLGPNQSMGLDNTLTTLYPGTTNPMGMSPGDLQSPLAPPPPPDPNAIKPFDLNDAQQISQDTGGIVQALVAANSKSGTPFFPSLQDVQNAIAVKYGPLYDIHRQSADAVIEHTYHLMGGSLAGAPPTQNLPFGVGQILSAAALPAAAMAGVPNRLGYALPTGP